MSSFTLMPSSLGTCHSGQTNLLCAAPAQNLIPSLTNPTKNTKPSTVSPFLGLLLSPHRHSSSSFLSQDTSKPLPDLLLSSPALLRHLIVSPVPVPGHFHLLEISISSSVPVNNSDLVALVLLSSLSLLLCNQTFGEGGIVHSRMPPFSHLHFIP